MRAADAVGGERVMLEAAQAYAVRIEELVAQLSRIIGEQSARHALAYARAQAMCSGFTLAEILEDAVEAAAKLGKLSAEWGEVRE